MRSASAKEAVALGDSSPRRLLWPALGLAAVALLFAFVPYSSRNPGPLTTTPLAFLEFQRVVVGVLILLALGPAGGLVMHASGSDRRVAVGVGVAFLGASVTVYARWWFQPVAFLHGLPSPVFPNLALWAAAGIVAWVVAALLRFLAGRVRVRRLSTVFGAYTALIGFVAMGLLAPLAIQEAAPPSRGIAGGYAVAWEAPFAVPSYELSDWVLEAGDGSAVQLNAASLDPESTEGALYLVACTDAIRIDLATGREDWRTPLPLSTTRQYATGPRIDLHVAGDSLYVLHQGQAGSVSRVDKVSGALKWTARLATFETIYSDVDHPWVHFTDRSMLALPHPAQPNPFCYRVVDLETGKVEAVDDVLPEGYTVSLDDTYSPYAWVAGADGTLVLRVMAYPSGFSREQTWAPDWDWNDTGWLVGISPETAQPTWRVRGVGGYLRNPVAVAVDRNGLVSQTVLSPDGEPSFVYYSLPDGKLRWRVASGDSYCTAWLLQDVALLAEYGDTAMLRSVLRATGKELWRQELPFAHSTTGQPVLITADRIVLNWDDKVIVLNRADGSTVWQRAAPESGARGMVWVDATWPTKDDPVMVMRERQAGSLRAVAATVRLATGEPVELPGFEDTANLIADGYLLSFVGEEDIRSWHPALSGQTKRVKLQGQAMRTRVKYAAGDAIAPIEWGSWGLAFPAYAGQAFGSLGVSPHTGAYHFQADEVARKFGGQLLTLVRDESNSRCWVVALRQATATQ